ncbi:hypothetical protein C8R44DRAFT_808684 [Mycena epipterygia]|nr:hypothetical protein C8R44DRAFT_808684 [Mycena epipterygia]
MDLTPPTTPQRHQHRGHQIQRNIRAAEDASPHRRRVPHNTDENVPIPTATRALAGLSARSLGQLRRHQKERENRPLEPARPETNRSCGQKARWTRVRAEKEMRMDVDEPAPSARREPAQSTRAPLRQLCPSQVLQALPNGLLIPPPTQSVQRAARGHTGQHLRPRSPSPPRNNQNRAPTAGGLNSMYFKGRPLWLRVVHIIQNP